VLDDDRDDLDLRIAVRRPRPTVLKLAGKLRDFSIVLCLERTSSISRSEVESHVGDIAVVDSVSRDPDTGDQILHITVTNLHRERAVRYRLSLIPDDG
jgi:hypothetical protein